MKLLVTGGCGFIGTNFIRYWIKQYPHDQIINLDKITYAGKRENLADLEIGNQYQFVQGDICDQKLVDDLVAKVDVIVHFAAETHVDRSVTGPSAFIETNIVGTFTLLEAARKNPQLKRFHHISTDEVFGSLELDSPTVFTEKTPYAPHSPYSAAKAASDHLVRAYHTTYALPITISNCSNNYGPYQYPEKFIPVMILKAIQNQKLPIYGNGQNVRDWIHVEDHCRGIELILQKGVIGETYLLGGRAEKSNLEVVQMILKTMGKPTTMWESVQDRPGHDLRYAIDPSKAEQLLGWKPQYSFDQGLSQTIKWYQDNSQAFTPDEQGVHKQR